MRMEGKVTLDWVTLTPVVVGGFLTLVGGFWGAFYAGKQERKRMVLEKKIETYLDLMPKLVSMYEHQLPPYEDGQLAMKIVARLEANCGKALLFCNPRTRKSITALIIMVVQERKRISEYLKKVNLIPEDDCESLQRLREENKKETGDNFQHLLELREEVIGSLRHDLGNSN